MRIVNLALRMMDGGFDVPSFISKLKPKAFGIDLHWLPHAHGSLEIAKIVKKLHPNIPVIFGGLAATYYHEELIQYPQVDYVLRGDSTEPPLYELLVKEKDEEKEAMEDIPNLTWKLNDEIKVNPMSFIPDSLDYVDLCPELMIKSVLRYRDLGSVLPHMDWLTSPIMPIFTVKGCTQGCATCGGSRFAFSTFVKRKKPAYRSPESVVKNLLSIAKFSKGPIFLIGDITQAGDDYAIDLLRLLKGKVKNNIIFELFSPKQGIVEEIGRCVENWSLQLSPESHDKSIRRAQNKASYSNHKLEDTIKAAVRSGCRRVDVFFMIGLPKQTMESVMETISYCEHLFRFKNLSCFISPLSPFLDPGSSCFENQMGYRLFAKTLEEHKKLLLKPFWGDSLNYETEWMSKDDIVEVTYTAAWKLNELKLRYGRIDEETADLVRRNIDMERRLRDKPQLNYITSTLCDRRELQFFHSALSFKPLGVLSALVSSQIRL